MGLLEFSKLPVNTLVGADWKTFNEITKGRTIDPAYKGKFRLTKAVCRLLSVLKPLQDKKYEKLLADKPLEHVVDIALEVELHFQRAVPVLKGEHGAPVHPEVGGEHLIVKDIGDLFILQLLVRGEEELHDLHGTLIGDGEFAIGVGILAAVDSVWEQLPQESGRLWF